MLKIIPLVGVFILSLLILASFAVADGWGYTRPYGQDYRYRGGYIEPSYYPGFYNSFSYRPYYRSYPSSFRSSSYPYRSYSYGSYGRYGMMGYGGMMGWSRW